MRGKKKMGCKILAFVLSVCMLLTAQPNLWSGVAARAAEVVQSGTLDNLTWSLDADGVMTISGNGAMTDFTTGNYKNSPFYQYRSSMKKVVIEDGVTSIGSRAFAECESLTDVTVADSVENIGTMAFNQCTALVNVKLPRKMTSIGKQAFNLCENLKSFAIPEGVTSIENFTFSSCYSLMSVNIPKGVTSIGWQAFCDCSSLVNVTIPDSVTSIKEQAFLGCAFEEVTIPGSVTSIGYNAFEDCSRLGTVTFQGTTTIPTLDEQYDGVFNGCQFVTRNEKGIHVPSCQYLSQEGWSDYKSYIADAPHIKFSYTADGAVITQSCANCGEELGTAMLSVDSGADLNYTGSEIKPVKVTYSAGWVEKDNNKPGNEAIAYTNNTNAGTATAKLTIGGVTAQENFTIKAVSYTVAYSTNGGTIADENNFKKYTYGTGLTLPTPAKTGYTFDGWYEQSDFSGSKVTSISTTDTGAKTYYAKWTPSSYTISYNLDGGNVSGNPTTYTVESSTITINNPTKEGYTFTGWSGTDLTGSNNMTVTIPKGSTGNREYTAHWTDADYTVILNGNGGKGGTSLTSYKHGTEIALPTNWTRAGYTFAGWYEKADCTGTAVTKIPDTATGDKEYWAGWTPVSYSISYNLDDGTATGNPTSYTVESNAITLVNPTKEGYTFTGWSGTGLTGEQNTAVTIPKGSIGDRTYTAHWELKGYTVTLHTNGGTGGTNLTAYTYGTVTTLPTNWTKKGYVFGGWYDNENLTGTAVTSISATATGDKEYWAKWTDNIAPVIGTLTYNYQPKNLWQWLIGKDSLVITVPVTEEGSGADNITYTETPDGGTAETKTANITDGRAEITVSADFKGTVSIACTDKAGNTSANVTVGAGIASNGIIIEDNAPQIAFQAGNAERLPSGEYKTVPDITVTVTDNKDNAVSAGIASVSYKIGNGSEKTVAHDYTTGMVVNDSFTIPAGEISAGETEITVTATDNAGNSNPQRYTVKVHTHSGTLVPEVKPTCTTAGNEAYYTCTCGKWFSDSGCTDEITDHTKVVKKALGHDFSGKYQFDTEEHWMKCSRCDATDSREAHSFGEGSNHCTKCEFEKAGEGHTHTGELHER